METVFDRIKNLADSRGKSIVDVEADLRLSKNYLYKWKKSLSAFLKTNVIGGGLQRKS